MYYMENFFPKQKKGAYLCGLTGSAKDESIALMQLMWRILIALVQQKKESRANKKRSLTINT